MAVSQFGEPRGARGWLAAQVVARLTGDANRWLVDCLDIGPDDRVVDVGCGPGLALAYAAEVTGGRVVGVDASETMVRLARSRNKAAVRSGRVEVRRADAGSLPFPDASFTRAGSLNSLQFWPDPAQGLAELSRVVEPGGWVAVVLMARTDDPAGPGTPFWVDRTADLMADAGIEGPAPLSRAFGGVLHWALVGKGMAPHSTPRRTG